jgi:hypothetical protein
LGWKIENLRDEYSQTTSPRRSIWDKKQRDFRTVSKIVPVPESGPKEYRGGLIVVPKNHSSSQPNHEVILNTECDV